MDTLETMEKIIHELLDSSERLRTNYWSDLEISACSECGYTGRKVE